jgi:enoyl-[acyl-carrier-protein] reductase (NADH)
MAQAQPIRRPGQPDDIANMALFLASDESEWITGAAMVVDGGFTARAASFGRYSSAEWSGSVGYVGPSLKGR